MTDRVAIVHNVNVLLRPESSSAASLIAVSVVLRGFAAARGASFSVDVATVDEDPVRARWTYSLDEALRVELVRDADYGAYLGSTYLASGASGDALAEALAGVLCAAFPESIAETTEAWKAARSGGDPRVLPRLVLGTSSRDNPEIAELLERALLGDVESRAQAAVAIGLRPWPRLRDAATQALGRERDEGVRHMLEAVLGLAPSSAVPQPEAREVVILFAPHEIESIAQRMLPPGCGPRRCLFWIARADSLLLHRLLAAVPEPPLDCVDEGMAFAKEVCRLALASGRLAAVVPQRDRLGHPAGYVCGFHTAGTEIVRSWLEDAGVDLRSLRDVLAADS